MVSQQIPPGGAIVQLDTHLLIIIFYTIKLNFKTIIYTVDPLGPHSTCWVDDILYFHLPQGLITASCWRFVNIIIMAKAYIHCTKKYFTHLLGTRTFHRRNSLLGRKWKKTKLLLYIYHKVAHIFICQLKAALSLWIYPNIVHTYLEN